MNLPKRIAVDGKTYLELATSRRSVIRSNDVRQSTLGLFDAANQVLFVTTELELQQYRLLHRGDAAPPDGLVEQSDRLTR